MRVAGIIGIAEIAPRPLGKFASLLFSFARPAPLAISAQYNHKPAPFARPCVRVLVPAGAVRSAVAVFR
jgi:hypothetical protein